MCPLRRGDPCTRSTFVFVYFSSYKRFEWANFNSIVFDFYEGTHPTFMLQSIGTTDKNTDVNNTGIDPASIAIYAGFNFDITYLLYAIIFPFVINIFQR